MSGIEKPKKEDPREKYKAATTQELKNLGEEIVKAKEEISDTYDKKTRSRLRPYEATAQRYDFSNSVIEQYISEKFFVNMDIEWDKLKEIENDPTRQQEFRQGVEKLKAQIAEMPKIFETYLNSFIIDESGLSPEAVAIIARDSKEFTNILLDQDPKAKRMLSLFKWAFNIKNQDVQTDEDAAGCLYEALKEGETKPKYREMAEFILFIIKPATRLNILNEYFKLDDLKSTERRKQELNRFMEKGIISPLELDRLSRELGLDFSEDEIKKCTENFNKLHDVREMTRALTADSIGSKTVGDLLSGRNLIGFIGNISGAVSGFLTIAVNAKTVIQDPTRAVELVPNLALSGVLMFNQPILKALLDNPGAEERKAIARQGLLRTINGGRTGSADWYSFFRTRDNTLGTEAFIDYIEKSKQKDDKWNAGNVTCAGFLEFLNEPGNEKYKEFAERMEKRAAPALDGDLQDFAASFNELGIKSLAMYTREVDAAMEI